MSTSLAISNYIGKQVNAFTTKFVVVEDQLYATQIVPSSPDYNNFDYVVNLSSIVGQLDNKSKLKLFNKILKSLEIPNAPDVLTPPQVDYLKEQIELASKIVMKSV